MSYDKRLCDPLTEWMLEEGWQLSRRFMREIETEIDGYVPIELLLVSENLRRKWAEFSQRN